MIDLKIVQNRKPMRVFSPTEVRIVLLESKVRPGLEGALVASLGDEGTIRDMALRWSQSGSMDPWHDVIGETVKEAEAEGLIREAEVSGGVLTRLWRGDKEFEPVCGQIAVLEEKFDSISASWREFRTREKPLYDRLYEQSRKSLMACAEHWVP